MSHVRKLMSTLGGIFLAALLVAALAPKAARGVAAALVQIVPGTTTHIGQNESRMVSLSCKSGETFCTSVDSSGNVASAAYQVPAGFTLIITDYEFVIFLPVGGAGLTACDNFSSLSGGLQFLVVAPCALTDSAGVAHGEQHFTTGIRVGSGLTLSDVEAGARIGFAAMQGYLVPND